MSTNQTEQPDGELSNTSTNADNNDTTKLSFNFEQTVEELEEQLRPLQIIQVPEKGWFLTLGKYRLTDPVPTKEDVLAYTILQPYELTLRLITRIVESQIDIILKTHNLIEGPIEGQRKVE